MSLFHGDEDEMGSKDHALSIDEADRLLSGHTPSGRHDLDALAADLASLSATYHRAVDPTVLRGWATQAAAHAHLTPTDKGDLAATPASNAIRPASQASGLPKRRIPVLDSIAAFLATTLGKAVAAGALVAATTTGGLAATGNLPGQTDGSPETVLSVSDGHADDSEVDEVDDDAVDDDADDSCDGLEGEAHDACEAGTTPAADPAGDPLACDDDADDDADEVEGVDDDADADDDSEDACDDDEQESDDIESDDVESDDHESDDEVDEVEVDDVEESDADEVDDSSDDTEHNEVSDGSDAEEPDAD